MRQSAAYGSSSIEAQLPMMRSPPRAALSQRRDVKEARTVQCRLSEPQASAYEAARAADERQICRGGVEKIASASAVLRRHRAREAARAPLRQRVKAAKQRSLRVTEAARASAGIRKSGKRKVCQMSEICNARQAACAHARSRPRAEDMHSP